MNPRQGALGIMLAAMAGSCGDGTAPRTSLDQLYTLAGCMTTPDGSGGLMITATPCTSYGRPGLVEIADSGRLTLKPDGTFEVRIWLTDRLNPCYLSSPNNYCPIVEQAVDSAKGTYRIEDGQVTMIMTERKWASGPYFQSSVKPGDSMSDGITPQFIDVLSRYSVSDVRFTAIAQVP